MKIESNKLLLYAVTDRAWVGEKTLKQQVEEALKGGITCLQLREKGLSQEEFLKEAKEILELTKSYGVPLVINDHIRVAQEAGADGVHLGQSDMRADRAREILGPGKIIGVSARTVEQAVRAYEMGADYLGCGAVFGTSTKQDARPMDRQTLLEITEAVPIPVVAIGGINGENLKELRGTGVAGAALVSAIFGEEHIEEAVRALKQTARETLQGENI